MWTHTNYVVPVLRSTCERVMWNIYINCDLAFIQSTIMCWAMSGGLAANTLYLAWRLHIGRYPTGLAYTHVTQQHKEFKNNSGAWTLYAHFGNYSYVVHLYAF